MGSRVFLGCYMVGDACTVYIGIPHLAIEAGKAELCHTRVWNDENVEILLLEAACTTIQAPKHRTICLRTQQCVPSACQTVP